MAATQHAARVAYTMSGGPPVVVTVPEAASQSFKQGEFVYLSSGKATVCGNNPTSIYGMAVADATGTTDADCKVYLANTDTVFEANVYHGTAASAVTAITQRGTAYGIEVVSNKAYVAIDETSSIACKVIDISKRNVVGEQYGELLFQILDSVSQARHEVDEA